MKEELESVRSIIHDTVVLLCRNSLTFGGQLKVQGLLGVTVDDSEIFLVHFNELLDSSRNATEQLRDASDRDHIQQTLDDAKDATEQNVNKRKWFYRDNNLALEPTSPVCTSWRKVRRCGSSQREKCLNTGNLMRGTRELTKRLSEPVVNGQLSLKDRHTGPHTSGALGDINILPERKVDAEYLGRTDAMATTSITSMPLGVDCVNAGFSSTNEMEFNENNLGHNRRQRVSTSNDIHDNDHVNVKFESCSSLDRRTVNHCKDVSHWTTDPQSSNPSIDSSALSVPPDLTSYQLLPLSSPSSSHGLGLTPSDPFSKTSWQEFSSGTNFRLITDIVRDCSSCGETYAWTAESLRLPPVRGYQRSSAEKMKMFRARRQALRDIVMSCDVCRARILKLSWNIGTSDCLNTGGGEEGVGGDVGVVVSNENNEWKTGS